jgi:hypothetical protein
MAFVKCVFRARDTGLHIEFAVSTTWSVRFLRTQVEEALGIRVHTLKYNRREITDGDQLQDLGLKDGATIFVNSQTLAASLPVTLTTTRHPASEPPRAREVMVEWRRPRPRVCGFSKEVIQQRVNRLVELGYQQADCEKALRAAAFNMDRAVDYLTSGNIPEPLAVPAFPQLESYSPAKVGEPAMVEEGSYVR